MARPPFATLFCIGVIYNNSVSGNEYTPTTVVACGIQIFEADGVEVNNNKMFKNEKNICNEGKGGGNSPVSG